MRRSVSNRSIQTRHGSMSTPLAVYRLRSNDRMVDLGAYSVDHGGASGRDIPESHKVGECKTSRWAISDDLVFTALASLDLGRRTRKGKRS